MKSAINPTNFRRKARPASKEKKTAATFTIGPKHKRHFSLQACDHIGIFTWSHIRIIMELKSEIVQAASSQKIPHMRFPER